MNTEKTLKKLNQETETSENETPSSSSSSETEEMDIKVESVGSIDIVGTAELESAEKIFDEKESKEENIDLKSSKKDSEKPNVLEVKIMKEEAVKEEVVEIYTDGACSGNPGPGGWAAVMFYNGVSKEISGGEKLTTNNKMELLAAIKGLKEITKNDLKVKVYTDSMYLKQGITEWIKTWKLKNYKDVKNVDLWKELDSLSEKFNIEWNWVKAHAGNKNNEIADKLAREESMKIRYAS